MVLRVGNSSVQMCIRQYTKEGSAAVEENSSRFKAAHLARADSGCLFAVTAK
jgi:hypothetical protein